MFQLIIDDKDEKLVGLKEQLGEARCTRASGAKLGFVVGVS